MKNNLLQVFLLLTCLYTSACRDESKSSASLPISVIPKPAAITQGSGQFEVSKTTQLYAEKANPEALRMARLFAERFQRASGTLLSVEETTEADAGDNAILFTSLHADTTLGNEGYTLSVKPTRIRVKASSGAGLFYGLQTLFQLLPAEIESDKPNTSTAWLVLVFLRCV